ncbi:MAG TPA: IS1595 family transposase [Casimicrobiaceae bacterium]|nr:IS1595 family transposase [Casimicrobiaceae bacterium]
MSQSILSAPHFHNEEAAYRFVEARVWPRGPICPHCGGVERNRPMTGKTTRIGAYKCYDCRKPFTVKVGTIFESSHIPLRLWLQAIFLIASSKKGISSNQLHRTLGVTLKSAWFMSHRIRLAMESTDNTPFGQGGGSVEIDETFIGIDASKVRPKSGPAQKRKVLSLIDRNSGTARSMVVHSLKSKSLLPILRSNIAPDAHVLTDDASYYSPLSLAFAKHDSLNHSKYEYVRVTDRRVHTNTVEGFFSIFKRGMSGVYQHCAHHHLDRYLAEFDFRYSNRARLGVDDSQRAEKLLKGVVGKRLMYQTPSA